MGFARPWMLSPVLHDPRDRCRRGATRLHAWRPPSELSMFVQLRSASLSFALLFPNLLTSRLAWSRVMPCACTKLAISIDEANLLGPGMWSLGIVSPLALVNSKIVALVCRVLN